MSKLVLYQQAAAPSTPAAGAIHLFAKTDDKLYHQLDDGLAYQLLDTRDKLSSHAATTSAELAGVISDETGSGALVFANTPTLVAPTLGAAKGTSLVLGSAVFYPVSSALTPGFQMNGTAGDAIISTIRWSANASGTRLIIGKSRGGSVGTHAAVAASDFIAQNYFEGSDGTDFIVGAGMEVVVMGTVSSSIVPAEIRFRTARQSDGALQQAFLIDIAQKCLVGGTVAQTYGQQNRFQVAGQTTVVGGIGLGHFSTTATEAQTGRFERAKSHSSTLGTNAIVAANEVLGADLYYGANGTGWDLAAQRLVEVGGTPGASSDMPGRIRDFVTPDGSATPLETLRQEAVASAVNYIRILNSVTTAGPSVQAQGSDTNIDLQLTPKGTGVLQFGTRSALAGEVLNGYITIKDAGGTPRKLGVIA